MASQNEHIINFNPGPAKVPQEVLRKAQEELIHYKDTGISVMEMSHRSPEYETIIQNAENLLREIMSIPDNYKVLFMHGGGTGQFASIPLNLCSTYKGSLVNYVVTGAWSEKAAKEADKYLNVNRIKGDKYTEIADPSSWNVDPSGSYLFHTDNETIHGVEYQYTVRPVSDSMPVVVDMTSNFLTRPIEVSNYGAIIAGTQKNAGIAGLAIVVVREDLVGKAMSICPSIFDYKILNANKSLYNTPPGYPIYMCGLFLEWIKEQGGLEEMGRRSQARAKLVYDVIDNSNGFYVCPVHPSVRSRVNACFRIGNSAGDEALEKKFVTEAKQRKMIGVKGHRMVGGIRISMFNAMPVEDVQTVTNFMVEFLNQNRN